MSTRGLKGAAVGLVCLLLVLLGAHRAWEQRRYELHTPKGTVRVGMTRAEVEAVLGSSASSNLLRSDFALDSGLVRVFFDDDDYDKVRAVLFVSDQPSSRIPRPFLFEHVRSWLPGGQREE
jgi:hypothetical protein